ncbi:MAG: hypothetical protein WCH46_10740 [bacterium]
MKNTKRSMRRAFVIAFVVLCSATAHAQLPPIPGMGIIPTINNPSPYLSSWESNSSTAQVIITNPGIPFEGKIWVEIYQNNVRVAYSQPSKLQTHHIPTGSVLFNASTILPFNAIHFESNIDAQSKRAGRVPDGLICIKVHVLDEQRKLESVSGLGCAMVMSYSPGELISPSDKAILCRKGINNVIDLQNNSPYINFQWSSVKPPVYPVIYHFAIFEVLPGQADMAAFTGGRPLFERDVLVNNMIWPTGYFLPEVGKKYVWSVRPQDLQGHVLAFSNDGWATPYTFTVTKGCDTIPILVVGNGTSGSSGGISGGSQTSKDSSAGGKKSADNGKGGANYGADTTKNNGNKSASKSNKPIPPRDTSSCGACSAVALTDTTTPSVDIVVGDTIKVGTFDMIVTEVTTGSPTNANGKGTIKLSWLFSNVLVEFKSMKINGVKQMVSGDVKSVTDEDAPTFPIQLGVNAVLSNSWTKSKIATLDEYLNTKGKISSAANEKVEALKTPIGVNNYNGYTLCISEIQFTKDNGILTAVASIPITAYDDTLSFGVTNLPFCKAGLSHKATLELLKDFTFNGTSSANSFKVTLKTRAAGREGCYISWNCTSFDTLAVDLDVIFPRTWLTPNPDPGPTAQVAASFLGKTVKWKDWIFKGSLQPCTIAGTNGVGLEITDLTLDLSDVENTAGMTFPKNYSGTQGDDFKGIYAKTISVTMPDGWRTFDDPDKAPKFSANNLIIAKTGLTGEFIAANVVQYPKGDIARMSGSLDTVSISLVNTSLTQAYVVGKINLPIGDADAGSALVYKALFNVNQKKFDFTLKPDKDITTNLFAGASLTINQTSLLAITISKTQKKFALTLNGSVGWNDKEITVPSTSKKIKVNFAPTFQGVNFTYDDKATPQKFSFTKGTWSFASPQKKLAGFPISIKNISIETQPTSGSELLAAALKFDLSVNLDSNRIGGDGTFRLVGAIEKSSGDSKFKFKPKFKDFFVDQISIHADLSAVKISGTLNFYYNDVKWGDGFSATIKATFSSMAMELSAGARFGLVNNYRYWYVEAKAILPTGIPFMTGYALYGAGVAAWYHMNVNMAGATPSATAASTTSASSGATMNPDKNISLGFQIKAVLGTTPDPSKMNGDIGVGAQFNASGGITVLNVSGQLWMMAKFADRATAPVYGSLNVNYDFPNKIFSLNASININKPPITGSGTLKVYVNGTNGLWYVKIGDPTNRVTLTVNVLGSRSSHSYFMFGNNINPPSSFMQTTLNGLARAGCGINNSVLTSATNSAKSGVGLATGFEIGFSASGNINILVATINWSTNAGAEANLSLLRYDGTPCPGFTGYNKWYVRGSIAVYGGVSVSMHVSPWNIGGGRIYHPCCGNPFKGCFYDWSCYDNLPTICLWCCGSGCNYNLATLNIGAYLSGGFPNPAWVTGSVAGNYNLLGGLIAGSFSANFSKGTQCTP